MPKRRKKKKRKKAVVMVEEAPPPPPSIVDALQSNMNVTSTQALEEAAVEEVQAQQKEGKKSKSKWVDEGFDEHGASMESQFDQHKENWETDRAKIRKLYKAIERHPKFFQMIIPETDVNFIRNAAHAKSHSVLDSSRREWLFDLIDDLSSFAQWWKEEKSEDYL